MGQCCSCVRGILTSPPGIEMNAADNSTSDQFLPGETMPQVHSIDVPMTAPTIKIANETGSSVTGHGLALADVAVEQDRAYWEWRVKLNNLNGSSVPPLMFGVSNKRNAKFYDILAESSVPPEKHGTKFMCAVPGLKDGDVVGVVVQQSELPMIQLYVNGETQDGLLVSRFRGTVYPSVYLPQMPTGSSVFATFLYRDDQFAHGPPSEGIAPLIAERSLM